LGGVSLSKDNTGFFDHSTFEAFVDKLMKEYDAPGLCVGIISKGDMIYSKGFGYRNLEQKLPVTEETVFGIASVSKSFSALAIMQLAERGLLSVEHPVKRYLPGFGLPDNSAEWKVNIHNFLTHTPGIPPLPSLNYGIIESTELDEKDREELSEDELAPDRPSVEDTEGLLKFIANHDYQLLGRPGQYVSYSNDAYGLLGSIIELVSGKSYEDYLQENILMPLGMAHTTTRVDRIKELPDVTSLYYKDKDDNLCTSEHWQEAPSFTACGFIKSTVRDLLSYLNLYLNNGTVGANCIASPCSISRMVTPYYLYNPDVWYGYGFNIRPDYQGVTLIQHSGSLRGVASNIGYVPEKDFGVVVLCNLSGFPASKVWLGAVNLLLGLPVDNLTIKKEVCPQPVSRLLKFAGTYRSGEGAIIKVQLSEDKLEAEIDSKAYPVETTGWDTAVITVRGIESHVRFLFNPAGDVWALRYGSRIILKADD
jgi:CubicO group peptidase (beta-lactamase class C family)